MSYTDGIVLIMSSRSDRIATVSRSLHYSTVSSPAVGKQGRKGPSDRTRKGEETLLFVSAPSKPTLHYSKKVRCTQRLSPIPPRPETDARGESRTSIPSSELPSALSSALLRARSSFEIKTGRKQRTRAAQPQQAGAAFPTMDPAGERRGKGTILDR